MKKVVEEAERREQADSQAERCEPRQGTRRIRIGERVLSCCNGDRRRRAKLDFGSRKPLDDLHRATHTWGSAKDRKSLWWRKRLVQLAAVVPSREGESKAVGEWHAAGWPGSRSCGCARSLAAGHAVGSGARTRRGIGA